MSGLAQRLNQGLLALNLSLTNDQVAALLRYVDLIEKWNKTYNLTAVRAPLDMVTQHLLDSVAILPHLKPSHIADIGTGAGLPGIPLAICRPDIHFTLVDANSKKTRFVQQAVLELGLNNVEVLHARVEQFAPVTPFSMVLTRAFADMADTIRLTQHLLAEDGVLLAMKGQHPEQEMHQVGGEWQVIALTVPGIDAARCLIRWEALHG